MHCAGYIWEIHQNKKLNKERRVDHTAATARHNPQGKQRQLPLPSSPILQIEHQN
jgi:hypothetical protein